MKEASREKRHYGWIIVLGCALYFYMLGGIGTNSVSVNYPFIRDQNGFTQTQISLLGTVRSLSNALAMLLVTAFYRKMPLRRGLLLAGSILCLGYLLLGLAAELPLYLAGMALIGLGYGLGSMVPLSLLVNRWFVSRRTQVISIISAMSGLGMLGIPSLLTGMIKSRGLRFSLTAEACFLLLLTAVSILLLRESPETMGLKPYEDGSLQKKKKAADGPSRSMPLPRRICTHLMVVLNALPCSVGWSCLALHAATEGFSAEKAAVGLTLAGIGLLGSKLLYGAVSEKQGVKKTSCLYYIGLFVGTGALCLIGRLRFLLYPAIAVYAASLALITIGDVVWVGEWFPEEERRTELARFQLLYAVGSLLGGPVAGMAADAAGSYVPFYLLCILAEILTLGIMLSNYRAAEKNFGEGREG